MNPARAIEKIAVAMVKDWVSADGTVNDISAGGGLDFEIEYRDGRTAVGEVTWHVDPTLQAMWGETFKQARHQTVELEPGRGTWTLHLVLGANIKNLHRQLPAFIDALIAASYFQLEVVDGWPRNALGDTARSLGIEYIVRPRQNDGEQDIAVYFMPGSGGTVDTDPNVVPDWVEATLADPHYEDIYKKLLRATSDERHVVLMSGSLTPFSVDERLRRLEESLPSRALVVPAGITHVWALPQFGPSVAALWTADGWTTVPIPMIDTE